MSRNREISDEKFQEMQTIFSNTIHSILTIVGDRAFRSSPGRAMNAAIFDSVMVATAKRLEKGVIGNPELFKKSYYELLSSQEFKSSVERSTTDLQRVEQRIKLATEAFANVP